MTIKIIKALWGKSVSITNFFIYNSRILAQLKLIKLQSSQNDCHHFRSIQYFCKLHFYMYVTYSSTLQIKSKHQNKELQQDGIQTVFSVIKSCHFVQGIYIILCIILVCNNCRSFLFIFSNFILLCIELKTSKCLFCLHCKNNRYVLYYSSCMLLQTLKFLFVSIYCIKKAIFIFLLLFRQLKKI